MKIVWNGFDTDPHTLPKECAICLGATGGEFVVLPCGHGSRSNYPLHVKCIIQSLSPVDPDEPTPPRCPVCRTTIDKDTLSRLAGYILRDDVVAFPDDNDVSQEEKPLENKQEGYQLLNKIVNVHVDSPEGEAITPSDDELRTDYYDFLVQHAEQVANRVQGSLNDRDLTPDDFDARQLELDDMENQLELRFGRVALLGQSASNLERENFFAQIEGRLHRGRQSVKRAEQLLCDARVRRRQEEEERRHEVGLPQ